MERAVFFNNKVAVLREKFESYKKDTAKPEHSSICDLYMLYDESMSWFYAEERSEGKELERWREQQDLAGIKAHKIYTKLNEKGIKVAYDINLLKDKKELWGYSPERLEFHLDGDNIENLLNFCIIGTNDLKKIEKMKNTVGVCS